MQCPNCGAEAPNDALSCPNCETKLESIWQAPRISDTPQEMQTEHSVGDATKLTESHSGERAPKVTTPSERRRTYWEAHERRTLSEAQEQGRLFAKAEKRVWVIGWLQLIAAVVITLLVIVGLFSESSIDLLSVIMAIPLIALNAFAGYTAIKERAEWYWVSVLNQALQIPSVALGSIVANYSGLGGIWLAISWGEGARFGVSANFSPGFAFQYYPGGLPTGHIAIDILAIIFIVALLTVKERKATANKQ